MYVLAECFSFSDLFLWFCFEFDHFSTGMWCIFSILILMDLRNISLYCIIDVFNTVYTHLCRFFFLKTRIFEQGGYSEFQDIRSHIGAISFNLNIVSTHHLKLPTQSFFSMYPIIKLELWFCLTTSLICLKLRTICTTFSCVGMLSLFGITSEQFLFLVRYDRFIN